MSFYVVPINGQTWLICGGRNFADPVMFDSAMSDLTGLRGMPAKIVHGGAGGVDSMANHWGQRHALEIACEKAEWNRHGNAAGPIRNQAMLDKHKPNLVVAFPGGRGTADMVTRSRAAGVSVAEIRL